MSFIDKFLVGFFNKQVGEDRFGNSYYSSMRKNYLGKEKRFVVYKGVVEPSKVPPQWHAWLHHLSDELPKRESSYSWQQNYLPNLTGTKYSYYPKETNELNKNKLSNEGAKKVLARIIELKDDHSKNRGILRYGSRLK
jgi:NADH:ubiquinone oxidoreductase subunit